MGLIIWVVLFINTMELVYHEMRKTQAVQHFLEQVARIEGNTLLGV